MTVDVKRVQDRRKLRFASLDAVLADAQVLVAAPRVRQLGNWPLNPLLTHLARAIDGSIDGFGFRAPWFVRLIAPLFKARVLKRGMAPGIKLPKANEDASYIAADTLPAALAHLQHAITRTRSQRMTAAHPALGPMTHEEWSQFHCRHAELHLSFVRADGTAMGR